MMSDIRKAILIIIAVSLAAACKKDPPVPASAENPLFSLELPSDYIHVPRQGIDTYVGHYIGSQGTIWYDCGYLSFGELSDIEPGDFYYYEETTVDGVPAKIVMEDRSDGQRMSLYIDKDGDWKKLRLYTINPSKHDFFFFSKVFKSLRFK